MARSVAWALRLQQAPHSVGMKIGGRKAFRFLPVSVTTNMKSTAHPQTF